MIWLWLIIPAAYLCVAAMTQPRIALTRYIDLDDRFKNPAGKREASAEAFWLSLCWPVTLVMMRGNQTIQNAIDAEQERINARATIERHNREQARREANEFEIALNGGEKLPKHVKAKNLTLDFIGAHIKGETRYGHEFSGQLQAVSCSDTLDKLSLRVSGEYKHPEPDAIITINGGY